jgi:protein TonB
MLWLVCVSAGALGFLFSYARPGPDRLREEPMLAPPVQVELAKELVPSSEPEPIPPDPLAPPPPPDALVPPAVAQPIAVAPLSPAIAFPIPVEGPARVVDFNRAEYTPRPTATTNASPSMPRPVQALTLGEGEGKQPAPEYPRAAMRLGQEGTVVVRLTVDESGRVTAAEAVSPSPWPVLNEAALRTVRERWRFRSGPVRVYEAPIRFELTK